MSRIAELMKLRCPHGVRFEALGNLLEPGTNIRWSDVPGKAFQYIDLTSVDRITHSIGETETITGENAPSRAQQVVREGDVLFGTTRPMLKRYCIVPAEFNGQIASTGYCVLRPKTDRLLTNFLFHVIGTVEFYEFVEANERGASYPAIPDGVVKEFRVPVPPVEVQEEIVRVLDFFQSLEAELEAELEARRIQYAHYRDSLLSFSGRPDVEWAPMGRHGEFVRGRRFVKDDYTADSSGVPSIHYGEIYTHYGIAAYETVARVRSDLTTQLRYAEPGDVVVAGVGETVEDIGKAVAWLGDEDVAIHDDCFAYRHDESLDPKFVAYCMRTTAFNASKARFVSRAKMKRLSSDGLKKMVIPVPPRAEQERLVAILHKFDALVNDLSEGLPAELAARRTQYQYYRGRLLTFAEVAE